MTSWGKTVAALFALSLSACGSNEIDLVKEGKIDACSTATVGDMLISYFPTTDWVSYQGATPTTFTIFGSGDFLYAGTTQTAKLEFSFDSETGEVTFIGGTFNGQDQLMPTLMSLFTAMCEDAS